MEHRVVKAVREMIEEAGYVMVSVSQNKHLKFVVSNGIETRILITATSCSDRKAHYQVRRTIKHLFK